MTTIYFNNQTGSDTLASGAGPSTAITGTAAAHTNGAASTTITLTNSPDLTNVLTDGTHAIWLVTASGRQLSFITAKDNTLKTVTVGDSFTIASGSAVNYAIGGKRRTIMSSTQIFSDAKTGWTYVLEYTGTNYVITADVSMGVDTSRTITGDSETNLTTIELQHNGNGFLLGTNGGAQTAFRNIRAISTSATKTQGAFVRTGNAGMIFVNCILGDPTNKLFTAGGTTNGCSSIFLWNTAVINCLSFGISPGNQTSLGIHVYNSLIANNAGEGIVGASGLTVVQNSVFYNNSGNALRNTGVGTGGGTTFIVNNSIFANNTTGLNYGWGSPGVGRFTITNSIFINNSTAAISSASHSSMHPHLLLGNVFFNNGSKYSGLLVNQIVKDELNIDPQFVSPSTYDFTVGNPLVKGKSYPQVNPAVQGGAFYNYGTAGAAQPQASGGGLLLPMAMNGGYSA